jgi:hypothetical protein
MSAISPNGAKSILQIDGVASSDRSLQRVLLTESHDTCVAIDSASPMLSMTVHPLPYESLAGAPQNVVPPESSFKG